MSNSRLVSRNFLAALVTQLLSWGLSFAVTLFLPRYAGEKGLGQLAIAGSFVVIFGVLAALGTSSVLVKEIARDRTRAGELLSAALLIRVPLAFMLGILAYSLSLWLHYSSELQLFILVAAIGMVFATINDALGAVLQGMENLTRQGIGILTDKFLVGALSIVLIQLKQPLWTIASVGIVTALVSCAVNMYSLRSILPSLFKKPDFKTMKYLAISGFAFVGLSVFVTLYGQSDPIILKIFTDDQTIGWYAVAGRLVGTALFIPTALSAALLPTLGRLYVTDKPQLAVNAKRVMNFLAVWGVPVAVILMVASHRIIELLPYPPGFAGGIPVLRVGGVTVLLYYLTVGAGLIIVASDRQNRMVAVFGMSCLIGIPACIAGTYISHRFFHNGAVGAVISDTLMELLILAGLMRILKDIVSIRYLLALLLRLTLAVVPMTVILFWLTSTSRHNPWLGGLWGIFPGLLLYIAGCFLLGCVNINDSSLLLRKILTRDTSRTTTASVSDDEMPS